MVKVRTPLPGVKQCNCGNRSFMNGFCLSCEAQKANAANIRPNDRMDGSFVASCMASIRAGVIKDIP